MPLIKYIDINGEMHHVTVKPGTTFMQAAVSNFVEGIPGICHGSCICGTCHIHVDEEFLSLVGPANENEQKLLNKSKFVQPNSRLGCQIKATEEMDGICVRVARRK